MDVPDGNAAARVSAPPLLVPAGKAALSAALESRCKTRAVTGPFTRRAVQFFRCDSTCLGFIKESGAAARSPLRVCRSEDAWGDATQPSAPAASPLGHCLPGCLVAGQCLACQDGSYALDGGGKECTPCPSGSGFCPGTSIVLPEPGHWQARRCRSLPKRPINRNLRGTLGAL
jgi:hypothetical protein